MSLLDIYGDFRQKESHLQGSTAELRWTKSRGGFPPPTHTYFSPGQTWFSTREDHLARPLSTMVFDRAVISGRYVYMSVLSSRDIDIDIDASYRATTIINNWVNELRGRWYVPTDSYIRRPTSDTHTSYPDWQIFAGNESSLSMVFGWNITSETTCIRRFRNGTSALR